MRITKMVRCRIRDGRASIFLATCREIKNGTRVDSGGRTCRRDYSHRCKSNQGHEGMPQGSESCFLSGDFEKIYGIGRKIVFQSLFFNQYCDKVSKDIIENALWFCGMIDGYGVCRYNIFAYLYLCFFTPTCLLQNPMQQIIAASVKITAHQLFPRHTAQILLLQQRPIHPYCSLLRYLSNHHNQTDLIWQIIRQKEQLLYQ